MHDDDDAPQTRRYSDWDCPSCNANNPVDEKFTYGDDLFCFYCGSEYEVRERDGRPRFVEK